MNVCWEGSCTDRAHRIARAASYWAGAAGRGDTLPEDAEGVVEGMILSTRKPGGLELLTARSRTHHI